ncbi:MAG: D-2-hydroxyacid dehydrogenase [Nitrospirota bacterium]|nr:D-2-hydroxyacid dehydrogenase [Nitrospirota bacterium]
MRRTNEGPARQGNLSETGAAPLTVLIASPLEPEMVDRIAAAEPERVRVIFEPALLPEPRYVADHKGRRRALSAAETERWLGHLRAADVLFDLDWLAEEALPQNAPGLRWVQATSAGIGERLRRTGLTDSGILFTTAAGVHGFSLAEFVILGLLYFYRDVPRMQRMQAAHHWERYTNSELAGRRVLLLGLGSVGRPIARRLGALDVEVWGVRRTAGKPPPEGVSRVLPFESFREALGEVDALVLACPLTETTERLIGAVELAALPPHALLINVARGPVVNERTMIDALRGGKLRGAVLDVAEVEPLAEDSALWDLPNVLISPHSASTVEAENSRIVDLFIDNLRRFLDGRPLLNRFERDRGY